MKALIQTNKTLIMLTGTSYFLKGGKTLLKQDVSLYENNKN